MVPDPMSRYKQLLYFASKLKELPSELKVDDNKVQGCVSQVWVVSELRPDGTMHWRADSDAQLTKGLAALLLEGLNGCTPREVCAVQPDFIEMLGLRQSLTPSRNNGFLNMFRLMQSQALRSITSMSTAASDAAVGPVDEASSPPRANEGDAAGEALASTASSSTSQSTSSGSQTALEQRTNGSGNGAGGEQTGEGRAASGVPSSGGAGAEGISWRPTAECPKPVAASIRRKLTEALSPTRLEVVDDSGSHAGHAGARGTNSPSGETHFKVTVVSDAFAGQNAVKRHRLVYGLLADELAGPVHALNLVTKAPSEL